MGVAVDLNSDLGESFSAWRMGDDRAMLDIVTSANIACGFHAGDPMVMHATVTLARERGVAVGAHPSLWDLAGFGRRPIQGENPGDIERQCVYQIGALQAVARAAGHPLRHVKAHGALYNQAAAEPDLAMALARAVAAVDPTLILVVLPGSAMEQAARTVGLPVAREVFADRAYAEDGSLLSRKLDGAVIHNPDEAAVRVVRMVQEQAITTVGGKRIDLGIDTICVHGDNPAAVAMARAVRLALEAEGVTLQPLAQTLGVPHG